MEPNELAKGLKIELQNWLHRTNKVTDTNLKFKSHEDPLWYMSEKDIVHCVTKVFPKGWHFLSEWRYKKGKESCDIIATKTGEKNIWIECKKILDDTIEPEEGPWQEKVLKDCQKDVDRLVNQVKDSRAYFVMFTGFVRYETNQGKRLLQWLNRIHPQIHFSMNDGIQFEDDHGARTVYRIYVMDCHKLNM